MATVTPILTSTLAGGFALAAAAMTGLAAPAAVPTTTPRPVVSRATVRSGWQWPLAEAPPQVIHRFDPGPFRWSPGHRGVDLAGATGLPVVAAGPGQITYAGVLAGRGVVVITHPGGLRTTYEPVQSTVGVGDWVGAGQVVGTLTATASHCGAISCLHWGLLQGTTYLDPLLLRRPPHPILLPLPDP